MWLLRTRTNACAMVPNIPWKVFASSYNSLQGPFDRSTYIHTCPWYSVHGIRQPGLNSPSPLLHRLSSMSKLLDEHLSVSNNGWLHVTQLLRLASENQNSAFTAHIASRETIAQDEPLTSSQLLQLCKWYQNLPLPQTDNISSAQLAKPTANGFSLDVKSDKTMNHFNCQVFPHPHACNAIFFLSSSTSPWSTHQDQDCASACTPKLPAGSSFHPARQNGTPCITKKQRRWSCLYPAYTIAACIYTYSCPAWLDL
jgi:hypothetical protein